MLNDLGPLLARSQTNSKAEQYATGTRRAHLDIITDESGSGRCITPYIKSVSSYLTRCLENGNGK